ncbi:MAG: hypothetical protein RR359_03585 [Bacilli bacterium]
MIEIIADVIYEVFLDSDIDMSRDDSLKCSKWYLDDTISNETVVISYKSLDVVCRAIMENENKLEDYERLIKW